MHQPSDAQLLSTHFLFHFKCKVSSTYVHVRNLSRVSVEETLVVECFSVDDDVSTTRYKTAERILPDIHSALIREITKHTVFIPLTELSVTCRF